MIESLEPVEKKQFLDLANYLQNWLSVYILIQKKMMILIDK